MDIDCENIQENSSIIFDFEKIQSDSQNISLTIKSNDWKELEKIISGKRPKFLAKFDYILSQQLQKLDVKCWLKCSYNRFNKFNPFWSGKYNCVSDDCGISFKTIIREFKNGEDVKMSISWQNLPMHGKLQKHIRHSGEERQKTAKEIMEKGLLNVQTENILLNNLPESSKNHDNI
jgi:hypothetical protein